MRYFPARCWELKVLLSVTAQCLNCKSKIDCPEKLLVHKYKLIFRIYFLHFQHNSYNFSRLNHLFIVCWLQKYCSCKAPEHAVPLQRGQGGTRPNWSSQILGQPTLPSLGGEFLAFQICKNFQITINTSQLVFPKMETAKSGLVQKCDPFWAVCKAGSKINPAGRQGRDVCRPEGNTEDFPSCHVCVGKATAAVLLGFHGNARAGAGHRSPSLSCHSPDRTGKPGPPSLPVLSTETGKPQVSILMAAKLHFCTAEHAAVEVPPSVQSSLHTLSTNRAPGEAQSLLQASTT